MSETILATEGNRREPWREAYKRNKARGDYEYRSLPGENEVDSLGRENPYYVERKREHRRRANRIKRTAVGMERVGFTNDDIWWYITSGWQSLTYQLDADMFQDLMCDMSTRHKRADSRYR